MSLDLSGVQAKLDRGYEHLHSLHGEVQTWISRYPYGLRHQVEDEGRRHSGTLQIYRHPDSTRFGLLIGDTAQNLRAALDHLVHAVARENLTAAAYEAAEAKLSFPITTTPEKWTAALRRGVLEGAGAHAVSAIERRQPHTTANPTESELFALQWLNNRDKHRVLHAVAAFPHVATNRRTGGGR